MLCISFERAAGPGAPPLYEQLYRAVTAQIRAGELAAGERMPGKRSLAAELGLSVNTVDTAYQLLAAEGWLEARQRSGFFVRSYERPLAAAQPPRQAAQPQPPAPAWRYDLSTGGVDTDLFPFRTWGRIQKELLYGQPELLAHGHPQGDEDLRQAIAEYLRAYRGVDCGPGQIVVGAGVEYLLGLVGRLAVGRTAALEDPGYGRPGRILENNGLACLPVPVDGQGLDPGALAASGADLVYVTPSHQFPTGAVMPAGRRAALLRWAGTAPGRLILEDDYDSEFRFGIRPLPSLQGMAGRDGPVVYLSTFSRSLAPSIRIACMVLPTGLLEPFRRAFGSYSSTVSRFEQQTLRLFLQRGHYVRHLARARGQYKARMLALTGALEAAFGPGVLEFYGQHTGLHLLLRFPGGPPEAEMVRAARAAGVRLTGLAHYCRAPGRTPLPDHTVVIGYGALSPGDILPLAEVLKKSWDIDTIK